MIDARVVLLLATVLGALGAWLMLPRGSARGRGAGMVTAAASLGMFVSQMAPLGAWLSTSVFYILAGVTIVAAAAAVTFRSPVYCAIWFGLTLTGTAGMFLFQGAQFLAIATIVVYAGAILVTFLFVLMLAQPTGRARYDRASWEAWTSACCGAVLVGILTTTLLSTLRNHIDSPIQPTAEARLDEILSSNHVAHIGGELFSRYLVAVEAAGVLLLAALVGASVIVGEIRGPLVGPQLKAPADRPSLPAGGDGHA